MYANPGGDRSKGETRQALAAAAMNTVSLSNNLEYVGNYASEKAMQLLFSADSVGSGYLALQLHGCKRCSSVSHPSRRHSSISVIVAMVLEPEQDA